MTSSVIIDAVVHLLTPINILLMFGGITLGLSLGSIPGFTGANTVAVMLPFTLTMSPEIAIVFLSCLYIGVQAGGALPAVLINTPGTAGATATVIDAYPMSKNGQASKAIGISIFGSVFGGLFSGVLILLLLNPIGDFAIRFGNREIFVLGMFGLAAIAVAAGNDTKKGLVAGLFGLFLATWPADPTTAQNRMDFGFNQLYDQMPFIPIVIGLFAISELIKLINKKQISQNDENGGSGKTTYAGILEGFTYVIKRPIKALRAMTIGLGTGTLPGAGGSVGGFISWATAKSMSKKSNKFGKGHGEGVLATESANSAVSSGALVPTLTLGIPGSATTAIMMAGLLLHGVRPGPTFMDDFAFEGYVIIVSLFFANLILLLVAFIISKYIVRVVTFPSKYLVPSILVLTTVGAFVVNGQIFDIRFMFLFGLIGLLLQANDYSLIPLVLGVILGPIVEGAYLRSMLISDGDPLYFFESSIALGLWAMIILVLFTRPVLNLSKSYLPSPLSN